MHLQVTMLTNTASICYLLKVAGSFKDEKA
jgi:hypothetical protein